MSTHVYLLRHAETATPDVFHGFESDVGLSVRGEQQAEVVAAELAGLRIDGLVSSGMLRARLTAATISRITGLPIRVELDLHERKVGDLQGTPVAGASGVWPDTLRRWVAGETSFAPPGAESFDTMQARLLPIWDRITREFMGESVAIVAHGIAIRVVLLSVLEGYNVADWDRLGRIANASISELSGAGRTWTAARVGDVSAGIRKLNEAEELRPPG